MNWIEFDPSLEFRHYILIGLGLRGGGVNPGNQQIPESRPIKIKKKEQRFLLPDGKNQA